MRCDYMDCNCHDACRDQWWVPVNTAINLQVSKSAHILDYLSDGFRQHSEC